jgi:GT2 family glycosyltransferase
MTETRDCLVTIGISTHNRSDILRKAIASSLAQSCPQIQVTVVDDASTDGTPAIEAEFSGLDWIRWDRNRGYVAARNHMMLTSGAKYYVSLDDDAWFLRGDEIAVAVDLMERETDIAAVAFDILSPDRPEQVARGDPVSTALFIGCGHVLRLDAVRAMNGYASFPGSYGAEEKDLCLRLLDSDYRIVRVPGIHVWHEKSAVARDIRAQHRSGVCNDLALALWRTPAIVLPIAIAWKLFLHFRFSVRARLVGPYLHGMAACFRSLPAILRARKPVKMSTLRRFTKLSRG